MSVELYRQYLGKMPDSDLATVLGVAPSTVGRWRRSRKIPACSRSVSWTYRVLMLTEVSATLGVPCPDQPAVKRGRTLSTSEIMRRYYAARRNDGNISATARELGISRGSVLYALRKAKVLLRGRSPKPAKEEV